MSIAGVLKRAPFALASAVAFALLHLGVLYLYLHSGGSVSRDVLLGVGPWFVSPACFLLIAGLVLATFPNINYARALVVVVISGLAVTAVAVSLAFIGTPSALRDDRFEPNTIFLLMPMVQGTVVLLALNVVVAWHLFRRRRRAVA